MFKQVSPQVAVDTIGKIYLCISREYLELVLRPDKAVNLLNRLASETGGRAFFPDSISDLPQIAGEIVRDMRTQYVISYNPTNKAPDGTYRAIKVSVDQPNSAERRIALTRPGRMARREASGGGPKAPPVRLPATPVTGSTTKKP